VGFVVIQANIDALFSAGLNNGLPIDPQFLEYISSLAYDSKSVLPLPSLVAYLRSNNVLCKGEILIFVAKNLDLWNPSLVSAELVDTLTSYMSDIDDNRNSEANGLAVFLIRLAVSGHSSVLLAADLSIAARFQTSFDRFTHKIFNSDPYLARQLRSVYSDMLGDSSGTDVLAPKPKGNVKLSRVHRLLWLESLMVSSKIQGDNFLGELEKFFGDPLDNVSGIVSTAFDCLAEALQRKESSTFIPIWKGFIVKRLPAIIKRLGPVNDPQVCQPLADLDRGTVNLLRIYGGGDVLDEMFSSFPSTTSDIRHEFLQTCIDLEIVRPEMFQQTLGEEANIIHDVGSNHGKAGSDFLIRDGNQVQIDDLFSQSTQENPEHVSFDDSTINWLIRNFEFIDGVRQDKIAHRILAFVQEWINNQNFNCLSRLCKALSLNNETLDIVLLHIGPIRLLAPLIQFLDQLRDDDDDEANFQEAFADYGSIVLFIQVVCKIYSLQKRDFQGFELDKSVCLQSIGNTSGTAVLIDDMSDDRKALLGGWITALFDAGGISDDLMRMSSIQTLIVLIPSIFQQSVAACSANLLDRDVLKGGLDYFLQPFLLPMLLGAFRFLGSCLWASKDVPAVLRVLQMLVSPSGGLSAEATNIHKIVLSVVAADLKQAVLDVKARDKGDLGVIDRLLIALEPHVVTGKFENRVTDIHTADDLLTTVKDTINVLVGWVQAMDQGHVSGVPSYNLTCFASAVEVMGARRLLNLFLDELDFAEPQGSFEYALDVTSALVMTLDSIVRGPPRLDSSVRQLVMTISEESVIQLRDRKKTNPTELVVNGFRRLKQRIEALVAFSSVRTVSTVKEQQDNDNQQELIDEPDMLMGDDLGLGGDLGTELEVFDTDEQLMLMDLT
jgi:mediator of RNA polymerase II transcription subunit 5